MWLHKMYRKYGGRLDGRSTIKLMETALAQARVIQDQLAEMLKTLEKLQGTQK